MNDTSRWFAFFIGMAVGAAVAYGGFIATRYIDGLTQPNTLDVPPEAIVITRVDGVRCVGHVAAPPAYVGIPPRLWICTNEVPWYDATGMKIPTRPLGELP